MRNLFVRESDFIKNNEIKWEKLDKTTIPQNDDLVTSYSEVSEDTSYARTYYKNRSIRVYLNYLLGKLESDLMNKRSKLDRNFGQFWKYTIPKAMYQARKVLLLAFLVFLVFTIIGYYSAASDNNFTREVFGDSYVTMTLQNIEKGDPMAVYKQQEPLEMFFQIAFNNIRVGLFAFALGCLFGIGSLFSMLLNGIMIGAFMHFFYSRGLSGDFNLAVWMHGTFEIAMLIIESAAGFVMGLGLVNKGNYTTQQSFYLSSKKGIYILIATIPFTIFAAVIESFVTRYTEIPNYIRAGFIIACLLFTLYYFVIYPFLLNAKKPFEEDEELNFIEADKTETLFYLRFKKPTLVALDTLSKNFGFVLKITFTLVILLVALSKIFHFGLFNELKFGVINGIFNGENFVNMFVNLGWLPQNIGIIVTSTGILATSPIWGFAFYMIAVRILNSYSQTDLRFSVWQCFQFIIVFCAQMAIFKFAPMLISLLSIPLFINILVALIFENGFSKAIGNSFKYGLFKTNQWVGFLTCIFISFLLAYLLHSPLFWTISSVVELFYLKEDLAFVDMVKMILLGLALLVIISFFILAVAIAAANYLLNKEMTERNQLTEAIDKMALKKQILGFEIE